MLPPVLVPADPPRVTAWQPDPAQERLIAHTGPGLVVGLGGPGTGKTSTLARAVAARLERGAPVSSIRVLAFNRARARDLRQLLAGQLPAGALPVVTTFHSLAFDILGRSALGDPDRPLPRLLSGAEEDVRIRDLLRGAVADEQIEWPADLAAALPTLGLANDVRAFLARARELDIDPDRLAEAGQALQRPEWVALAAFARHEAEVMALEDLVDYTALVETAIGLVEDDPRLVTGSTMADAPSVSAGLAHLYVDDFHEADPLQRQLLQVLCSQGMGATVFADPDVTAYAFRGADHLGAVRLISKAGVQGVALGTVYRGGGPLREAYERVRRQPALPGLPTDLLRVYRNPHAAGSSEATIAITAHDSLGDLAAQVARDLRRQHLGLDGDPVGWSDMAVLLPSARDIEVLRRSLESEGVPIRVATDALPLPEEPAVAVLLTALQAAVDPGAVSVSEAIDLVMGPLGGIDPVGLRALARELRGRYREAEGTLAAPPGTVLVRDLLAAAALEALPVASASALPTDLGSETEAGRSWAAVLALGELLAQAHAAIASGRQPAEVLWQLWRGPQGHGTWPERLREAALAGHRASGHDLDAVLALFDAAERLSERYAGALGVEGLLAGLRGQRLPGESIAARAAATPAVELLTARLAVGRSWRHVVIVGAQEGVWPRLTVASSSVHADALDLLVDGTADPDSITRDALSEHLADERRVFGLALTRASQRCHVAVIAREGDQGERPSRFVDDLQLPIQMQPGRPGRSLTLDGIVAQLRTAADDPDAPSDLRQAAVGRLAVLAAARDAAGDPLVPQADPERWWGITDPTPGVSPVRPADRPVALSGSGLQALEDCPLRWFLARAAGAQGPNSSALAFGNIVHVLAERVGSGELPAQTDVLMEYADRIWGEVGFDVAWQSEGERAALREALDRLCHYHRTCGRTVVDTEHAFDVVVPIEGNDLPASDGAIRLRGSIDRVEVDNDGGVHLIDFKTSRSTPTNKAVLTDPQLGTYQLAATAGALDDVSDDVPVDGSGDVDVAGAALVQLRHDAGTAKVGQPKIQDQPPLDLDEDQWLLEPIRHAITLIRTEDFAATPHSQCSSCAYRALCPAQPEGQQVGS